MTIYIDSDFKCHATDGDGLTAVETDAFDGKCDEWIESYRFVPAGSTWTRENGEKFSGEMMSPWKPLDDAYIAQTAYVTEQLKKIEEVYGV